jgi:adenylate kinase family enzyme
MRFSGIQLYKLAVIGAPGSGKGKICEKILQNYPKLDYRTSGDLLRTQFRKGTGIAKEAKIYMDDHTWVPCWIVTKE